MPKTFQNYIFLQTCFFNIFICFIFVGSAGRAEPFKSAAPVSQSGVPEACRILLPISADSKASDGPRPTRRPCTQTARKSPFADPQIQNLIFLADFLSIENSSKITISQKYRTSILIHDFIRTNYSDFDCEVHFACNLLN